LRRGNADGLLGDLHPEGYGKAGLLGFNLIGLDGLLVGLAFLVSPGLDAYG
jgi:hypothetical protein